MSKKLLSILIFPFLFAGCTQQTTYVGFYYNNAIYKTDPISQMKYLDEAPRFNSLQSCLAWGNNLLSKNPRDGFECGTGCRFEKYQAIICRDTTKMITKFSEGGSYNF